MSERNPFPGLRPFEFDEDELFFGREEQYEQMVGKLSEMRFLAVVGTSGSGKSSLVKAGLLPALDGGMMSDCCNWRVAMFRPKEDPIRELALALNHRRVFGDRSKENGSSLFKMTEAIDWAQLCSRLSDEAKDHVNNPSGRVLGVLPPSKREVIHDVARGVDVDESKSEFVQTFNDVLKTRNLYQPKDFMRVRIKGDAKALLSKGQNNLTASEIERLNRLLLEAAYPQEIAKNGEMQAQITEVTLRRGDLGLVEAAREAKMSPGESLLVVVDQFEELFRYAKISERSPHGNQAAKFVKLLLEAKSQRDIPIYVVLTMRSDYLGDCAAFWDLPEAINEGQYLIPRLTRDQRREAIEGPVKTRGVEIQAQLVNRLLNDTGDNPDQLPILQHALMRTWDNWEKEEQPDKPIDIHHYEAIGRMDEALSRHADEAFKELKTQDRERIAEKLFKCLTEKGTSNRETRRAAELKVIRAVTKARRKDIVEVIDIFRQEDRSFLTPPLRRPIKGDTSIDIAHESLIRNWTKLKVWVEEEARSASFYRRLVETAKLYSEGGAGLLTDLEVDYATKWLKRESPNVVWASRYHCDLEITQAGHSEPISEELRRIRDKKTFDDAMAFLETSRMACGKANEDKKKRRRKQLRLAQVVAGVFILAFVVCFFLFRWARAEEEVSKLLIYASNINSARNEFDRGDFARNYQLLGTLSSKDYDHLRGFEWYFSNRPNLALYQLGQSDSVLSVGFVSNAHQLASATADGNVTVWDTNTGGELKRYRLADGPSLAEQPSKVVFSPDGRVVATVDSTQREAKLWNMAEGQKIMDLNGSDPAERLGGESSQAYDSRMNVQALTISPDGTFLVLSLARRDQHNSKTSKNIIQIWDTNTYKLVRQQPDNHADAHLALAVSHDRKTLAIGISDGNVELWNAEDLTTAKVLHESRFRGDIMGPELGNNGVTTVAFSPDGKMLASGRANGSINIWNAGSNPEMKSFLAHPKSITSMMFSRDGKMLATASTNGSVKLWRADCLSFVSAGPSTASTNSEFQKCAETPILTGHSDSIQSVTFLSESNRLATGSADKTVGLWDTNKKTETLTVDFPKSFDQPSLVKFSAYGNILGAVSQSRLVGFWDAATMKEISFVGPDGKARINNFTSIAFSQSGKLLATRDRQGTITLWDAISRTQIGTLENAPASDNGNEFLMEFSNIRERLATWSPKDGITTYDTRTLKKISTVALESKNVFVVTAFSPDLRFLAAGDLNGSVLLWDTASGKQRKPLDAHSGPVVSIAFSADSQRLAAAYADNTVQIWNTTKRNSVVLKGHTSPVQAMAFSPDGKRLATGSWDASVKIWDTDVSHWDKTVDMWHRTQNQQQLLTLQEQVPIRSVAFSRDGKTLAVATADNKIKLW